MKEISIEEKAKRYDEALKAAVVAHKDEDRHLKATLERLFPELTESEDERIRQEIIYHVQNCDDTIDEETEKRMLAWLTKQGEQKPTENEPCEPWSGEQTRRNLIMYIKDSSKKGHPLPYSWRYIKWLENQKEATNFAELMNKLSSKEQEAMFNAWPKEQKPAWSEEDERMMMFCCDYLDDNQKSWLLSLKDRYTWKPSDEQMKVLNEVINFAADHGSMHWNDFIYHVLISIREQLKKL